MSYLVACESFPFRWGSKKNYHNLCFFRDIKRSALQRITQMFGVWFIWIWVKPLVILTSRTLQQIYLNKLLPFRNTFLSKLLIVNCFEGLVSHSLINEQLGQVRNQPFGPRLSWRVDDWCSSHSYYLHSTFILCMLAFLKVSLLGLMFHWYPP